MAFHDEVLRAIRDGRVPWRFRTSDLKKIPGNSAGHYVVGASEYSENTINTIPRNHSVRPDGTNPGDYVRNGRKPAFLWYGRGEFELILDHEHYIDEADPENEESDTAEGDEETLIRGTTSELSSRPLLTQIDRSLVLRIAEQHPDPVAIIIHYIAEQPFQARYRRKPVGSAKRGWPLD